MKSNHLNSDKINNLTTVIGGGGAGYVSLNNGYSYTTDLFNTPSLKLDGEDADIIINGVSLTETLAAINNRLLILTPNPALLNEYESLRQAYEHYKTLEALLVDASQGTKK